MMHELDFHFHLINFSPKNQNDFRIRVPKDGLIAADIEVNDDVIFICREKCIGCAFLAGFQSKRTVIQWIHLVGIG